MNKSPISKKCDTLIVYSETRIIKESIIAFLKLTLD
jgi:hypothetical protein